MNIPYCVLKDHTSLSGKSFEYHQILAKKLLIIIEKRERYNLLSQFTKEDIYDWLFTLNFNDRLKVCSIYNDWFTKILFQLLTYYSYDEYIKFSPRKNYESLYKIVHPDFIENFNYKKNFDKDIKENYNTFFEAKYIHYRETPNIIIHKEEKKFLKELKFISLYKYNDILTLSFDLLNSKNKLQEYFKIFSKNKIFTEKIIPIKTKENSNILNFSIPLWINEQEFFTISQLVTIYFEQIISINYQIYLYEGALLNLDIYTKIDELLNMNSKIENYLGSINDEENILSIFNVEKITEEINSKKNKDLIYYYENLSENVYEIAFDRNRSVFIKDIDLNEIKTIISNLKKQYDENKFKFVINLSFIDAFISFQKEFLIYNLIYHNINKNENKQKNKKKKRKNKKKKIDDNLEINIENKIENENSFNIKDNDKNICDNNNINKNNIINYEKLNFIINNYGHLEDIKNCFFSKGCCYCGKKLKVTEDVYLLDKKNSNKNDKEIKNVDIKEEEKKKEETKNEDIKEEEIKIAETKNEDIKQEEIKIEENKNEDIKEEEIKKGEIKKEEIKEEEINEEKKEEKNEIKKEELNESDLLKELMEMDKKKKKKKRKNKKKKENEIEEKQNKEIDNLNNVEQNINNINNNNINIINNISNNINNINNISNNNKNDEQIKTEIKKNEIIDMEDENKVNKKKKKDFFLFPVGNKKKKKDKKKDNQKISNNKELNNVSKNEKNENITETNLSNSEDKNESENLDINKINNKNNINIKEKEDIDELTDDKSNSVKTIENNENKENKENSISIKDNSNKTDYLNNFEKTVTINSNSTIINNYIFFEKNSFHNSPSFIDNLNKKDNKLFIQSQNSAFSKNSFGNSLTSFFNNPMPYDKLPNYYLNRQNELLNEFSYELLIYEKIVYHNLEILKNYREKILYKIKKHITTLLSENNYDSQIINYGSYETKLNIEISDIDMLIKFCKKNNYNINSRQHIEDIISLLENKLNKDKDNYNILLINAIYTASVPVLKIKCNLENIIPNEIKKALNKNYLFNFEEDILKLNLDFTFIEVNNIKEEVNPPSLKIISYIKNKINEYKEIKPILLFLKRYMKNNELNVSFLGGLSSYSLFLLVYAYIKSMFISGNSLGYYLYGFFEFYSNFNFGIYYINVNLDNPFHLFDELNESGMLLIDPITNLNVAKSTYSIDKIKSVLTKGFAIITNKISPKKEKNYNNVNIENKSFILELLKYKVRKKIMNQ